MNTSNESKKTYDENKTKHDKTCAHSMRYTVAVSLGCATIISDMIFQIKFTEHCVYTRNKYTQRDILFNHIACYISLNYRMYRRGINCVDVVYSPIKRGMLWRHENISPNYWPFVREVYQSPAYFRHNGSIMCSFDVFCFVTWTCCWIYSRVAGDLIHYDAYVNTI